MNGMRVATLTSEWSAGSAAREHIYTIRLTNVSGQELDGFSLCISGAVPFAPDATIRGGSLGNVLSTYAELLPPSGFRLLPGGTWEIGVRDSGHPMHHWSDGVQSAYLMLRGGQTCAVTSLRVGRAIQQAGIRRAVRVPRPSSVRAPLAHQGRWERR